MTPDDLARIHARAFAPERGWTAGEFRALLDAPGVRLLTRDTSFLLGRTVAGEAEILTLATDPIVRRRGHARALLADFISAAGADGCDRIILEVARDNRAALGLYREAGFVPVGLRRGYAARAGAAPVDALVMERRITAQGAGKR